MNRRWWALAALLVAAGCGSKALVGDGGAGLSDAGGAREVASDSSADGNDGSASDSSDAAETPAAEGGAGRDGRGAEVAEAGDIGDAGTGDSDASDATDSTVDAPRDGAGDGANDEAHWLPCQPGSRWFDVTYPVETAAYSRALDLLVLAPTNERAVHILDPESCSDRTVPLSRRGLSLSIAPSGHTVAVGEDGELSIVDLVLGRVSARYPISHPASEVGFDSKGRVQVFTRSIDSVSVPLLAVDVATGTTVTRATGVNAAGHIRITPDGQGLYWVFDGGSTEETFSRIDLETGAQQPRQNVTGSIPACHNFFPTDDSAHLITACGIVLDLANALPTQAPTPHGALEGVTLLEHVDSLARQVVVSIGKADIFAPANTPDSSGFVRVHDATTFDYVKRIDLPPVTTGNLSETPVGRMVFVRSDGSRYYVLARRDGQIWGPLADGIARLDAGATGQTVTTPIAVPVPPRYDDAPPTVPVPTTVVPVAFDIVDVAYSRSLDRLLVVSSKPTSALLLVDPATGAAQTLPTPAAPSKVSVRGDGSVAAIVRQGGITFMDLTTGTVLRDQATPATQVAWGPTPQALAASTASNGLTWVDYGTGITRGAFSQGFGSFAFATAPGTLTFYTLGNVSTSARLARHDNAQLGTDPFIDLSMFTPEDSLLPSCGANLWVSEDGSRLVLDCARVFRLSASGTQDLAYAGGLEDLDSVRDVAYAGASNRFFVIPGELVRGNTFFSGWPLVTVHEGDSLGMNAVIGLPSTQPVGEVRPRRLFVGPTANRLYLVADTGDFQPLATALVTLDVTGL